MKKLILTLVLLLTTLVSNAQIGVITIKKNQTVPLNMWYTIDEKATRKWYPIFDSKSKLEILDSIFINL